MRLGIFELSLASVRDDKAHGVRRGFVAYHMDAKDGMVLFQAFTQNLYFWCAKVVIRKVQMDHGCVLEEELLPSFGAYRIDGKSLPRAHSRCFGLVEALLIKESL